MGLTKNPTTKKKNTRAQGQMGLLCGEDCNLASENYFKKF